MLYVHIFMFFFLFTISNTFILGKQHGHRVPSAGHAPEVAQEASETPEDPQKKDAPAEQVKHFLLQWAGSFISTAEKNISERQAKHEKLRKVHKA